MRIFGRDQKHEHHHSVLNTQQKQQNHVASHQCQQSSDKSLILVASSKALIGAYDVHKVSRKDHFHALTALAFYYKTSLLSLLVKPLRCTDIGKNARFVIYPTRVTIPIDLMMIRNYSHNSAVKSCCQKINSVPDDSIMLLMILCCWFVKSPRSQPRRGSVLRTRYAIFARAGFSVETVGLMSVPRYW